VSLRLKILSVLAVTLGFLFAVLSVVEYQLQSEARMQLVPQTAFIEHEAPVAEISPMGTTPEGPVVFDPVEPTIDLKIWESQDQYTNASNVVRFSAGPEVTRQVQRPSRIGAVRVLVVGDSYVWGHGVEDPNSIWPYLLEQELNSDGGAAYEVVTLGRMNSSHMNMADWLTEQKVAELNPDIVVLAHHDNDTFPSYSEKALCEPLGTCMIQGKLPSQAHSDEQIRRVACIEGDSSLFNIVIRQVSKIFPMLARIAIERYCNSERFVEGDFRESELKMKQRPQESKYWPLYVSAVERIGKVLADKPTYLFSYAQQTSDREITDLVSKMFKSVGIASIPGPTTSELIRSRQPAELDVNPVNNHPSRMLASAYAHDVAMYLKSPAAKTNTAIQEPDSVRAADPVVSTFLPVGLLVSTPDHHKMSVSVGLKSPIGFPIRSNGTIMHAPCATLGRPHARVMFDPHLTGIDRETQLSISIEGPRPLILVPVFHDEMNREALGNPITVRSARQLTLPKQVAGLMIAGTESGCSLNEWFTPPFTLVVERPPNAKR